MIHQSAGGIRSEEFASHVVELHDKNLHVRFVYTSREILANTKQHRYISYYTLMMMSAKADLFESLKAHGNESFKAKLYEDAKLFYTRAIEVKGDEAVAYTNRAACHLNLKQYYNTIDDCNKALELDPKSCKAYFRRATAFCELSRHKSARDDFLSMLNLDPNSKLARTEADKLNEILEQDSRIVLKKFDKPEEFRSTKPMQKFLLNNQHSGSKRYNLKA